MSLSYLQLNTCTLMPHISFNYVQYGTFECQNSFRQYNCCLYSFHVPESTLIPHQQLCNKQKDKNELNILDIEFF